jgi:hypothetical protein
MSGSMRAKWAENVCMTKLKWRPIKIEIVRLKSDNLNFNLYIKQIINKNCLKILTFLNLDRSDSFEALKYL